MTRKHLMIAAVSLAFGVHTAQADTPRSNDQPGAQGTRGTKQASNGKAQTLGTASSKEIDQALASWPNKPKAVAYQMIKKYGPPHSVGSAALIWHNNGPWKRTTVFRYEVPHNFPKVHTDVLEQVIDAQIPVDKLDELANYDGSVQYNRTAGELAARCDMEEANFLALNLAHDVATGKRSADEAREEYGKNIVALMTTMQPPQYTRGLAFQPAKARAGDPDKVTIAGAPHPAKGEVRGGLGDAEVIAALITENTNEVMMMSFVLNVTKNADVQKLARTVKQHHATGLASSMKLGSQTNITPILRGPAVEMNQHAMQGMAKLAQEEGAAFDRAVIAMSIDNHERALATIDNKLLPVTKHQAVRAALTEARTMIAQHLEMARQLANREQVGSR